MNRRLIILFMVYIALTYMECELFTNDLELNATNNRRISSEYYVSNQGNDLNKGTMEKPFKSWEKAIKIVKPGDKIYIRGGVYKPKGFINYGVNIYQINGQPNEEILLSSYPNEKVILDCSGISYNGPIYGIHFKGNYWHIKGIKITGVRQSMKGPYCRGFSVSQSNNCIFENIEIYDIQGVGFHMTGDCNNNILINCDFHNNYDPYSCTKNSKYDGGNADGAHISIRFKGRVTTIENCRFWNNSDDGLDLWNNEGIVKIKKCWSFRNGYKPGTTEKKGDGQGFKLGQTTMPNDNSPQRYISNCVAFENRQHGFDQNDAHVKMIFYNNIAFNNGRYGFIVNTSNLETIFKNNISLNNKSGMVILTNKAKSNNNNWDLNISSLSEWISTDSKNMSAPRKEDGSLPDIKFLVPKSNSQFIDKGVNVGMEFKGKAPDLGAYEVK